MTAAKYCKEQGLPRLSLLSEHTGVSVGTLRSWYINKNKLFRVVVNDARNRHSLVAIIKTIEKILQEQSNTDSNKLDLNKGLK